MSAAGTCATCARPLRDMEVGGDRCNNCWEVERRLADYLRAGGEKAKYFVLCEALPRGVGVNEEAIAAALWERLVALMESDDGPTKAYDHEILEKIVALVDEWQGLAEKPEGM